MEKIYTHSYNTSIGELILGSYGQQLCLLDFKYRKMRDTIDGRLKRTLNAEFLAEDNSVLQKVRTQLDEYFLGQRKTFDIPLLTVGTDFQKSVWQALMQIPYGTTSSYLKLAQTINNEKAVRAVANANGANAIAIIIPCHRIIGTNGQLVGYGGGLPAKQRLLTLEQPDLLSC